MRRGRTNLKRICEMSVWLLLLLRATCIMAADAIPSPQGLVNDFAGVLTNREKEDLQYKLARLKEDTGFEIAVATVLTTHGETPFDYSLRMIRQWGVGDKQRGGVLFVVFTNDRQISVRVSTHGEGTVIDSQAGQARNAAARYFKQKQWGAGLNAGVDVLIARVREAANSDPQLKATPAPLNTQPQVIGNRSSGASDYFSCIPLILFILFVIFALKRFGEKSARASRGIFRRTNIGERNSTNINNINTQQNSFWGNNSNEGSVWDNSRSSSRSSGGGSFGDSSPFNGSSDTSSGGSSSNSGGSSGDSGGSFGGDSSSGGGADGGF